MSIRRITFAFPAVISYNKATCGAFEKLRSDLGYIKNIQIEVRFHKNRSFRLKRAALFLGEKEPPAILVGFPHML
jgi:hypothetical protein